MRLRLAICAAIGLSATAAAHGQQCNALGTAGHYNGFFFGDYTASYSDVQGRLGAAGDVSLEHYSIADQLTAETAGVSFVVGGDLVFPHGAIVFGDTLVGGSAAGVGSAVRNAQRPDQSIVDGAELPVDFELERQRAIALSEGIAALPANGTFEAKWGGIWLHGDCTSALQVFDLPDGQAVIDAHTFAVDCIPAGATIVFNIRGATAGLTNMGLDTLAAHRERTLFNFPEATTLQLAGIGVKGSILAPRAHVPNPEGVIEGTIVAASWNGNMQLNHVPFTGCGLPTNGAPTAVDRELTIPQDLPTLIVLEGSDPDGDMLVYEVIDAPAHGTLSGDTALGEVKYVPEAGYTGADTFTFRVFDGESYSAPASVALTIDAAACAP